jgi:hypothetical protein
MKKLSVLTSLLLISLANPIFAADNAHKITSYLLLERDAAQGTDSLNYLNQTLIPSIQKGTLHTDRLVLSFMDPGMNLAKVNKDLASHDLQNVLIDAGIFSADNIQQGDGEQLKKAVQTLQGQGVQVLFAVGGWAYSCKNPAHPQSNCTSNFPLTSDMAADFSRANLKLNNEQLNQIQPVSKDTTKSYTDTWVQVAKEFGATGIDLDYEENWFVAETSFMDPQLTINPSWASAPNGPFVIPYAVIKYAKIIKSLEESSKPHGFSVTMAASAAGAYNIHDYIGGSDFWCPISDEWGNKVCGQPFAKDQSKFTIGGNLKGILYDMANYKAINDKTFQGKKYPFVYNDDIFAGLMNGIDSINVMTYDLDDGYDAVNASWCIGKRDGQFSSRDPNTEGYKDIDCSLVSQTETIIEMYSQNVMKNIEGAKPHLGFGLEAGFPNYPINIDPSLAGGGNIEKDKDPSQDGHYRWNDPFIAFGIPMNPMTASDEKSMSTWLKLPSHQKSDVFNGAADNHSSFLIVNNDLFSRMQKAGADSMILWSLYNDDYNQHLSKLSWDFQQLNPFTAKTFARAYSKYDYDKADALAMIFKYAATPEDMLQVANQFYYQKK